MWLDKEWMCVGRSWTLTSRYRRRGRCSGAFCRVCWSSAGSGCRRSWPTVHRTASSATCGRRRAAAAPATSDSPAPAWRTTLSVSLSSSASARCEGAPTPAPSSPSTATSWRNGTCPNTWYLRRSHLLSPLIRHESVWIYWKPAR